MSLDVRTTIDEVASHAAKTGLFEQVNTHAPRVAPGTGMRAAVWLEQMRPVAGASGLNSTSALVVLALRIYRNASVEPQDEIDPELLDATSILFAAYTGDFTLGGAVRNIDLLGAHGQPLAAEAAFLEVSNGLVRIIDITLPIVIDDAWAQAE